MRKMAMAGAVLLGTAGTVVIGSVPASAAAKCWTGSWKVTSASADITTPELRFKLKGGAGVKLRLAANGRASYDFKGSKPLTGSGELNGVPTTAKLTLAKKLTMSNKISGSAKGRITARPKTAAGDATVVIVGRVGLVTKTEKFALAKEFRAGGDKGVVPRAASYTCTKKTLTIKQTVKQKKLTSTTSWYLRRA